MSILVVGGAQGVECRLLYGHSCEGVIGVAPSSSAEQLDLDQVREALHDCPSEDLVTVFR
jgi:hypothetical protein